MIAVMVLMGRNFVAELHTFPMDFLGVEKSVVWVEIKLNQSYIQT